jgi:hypothetical protein
MQPVPLQVVLVSGALVALNPYSMTLLRAVFTRRGGRHGHGQLISMSVSSVRRFRASAPA